MPWEMLGVTFPDNACFWSLPGDYWWMIEVSRGIGCGVLQSLR